MRLAILALILLMSGPVQVAASRPLSRPRPDDFLIPLRDPAETNPFVTAAIEVVDLFQGRGGDGVVNDLAFNESSRLLTATLTLGNPVSVTIPGGVGGGSFAGLSDTPDIYAGQDGRFVKVLGNGLSFEVLDLYDDAPIVLNPSAAIADLDRFYAADVSDAGNPTQWLTYAALRSAIRPRITGTDSGGSSVATSDPVSLAFSGDLITSVTSNAATVRFVLNLYRGGWSPTVTYRAGEIVTHNNVERISLVSGNLNNEPRVGLGPEWSTLLPGGTYALGLTQVSNFYTGQIVLIPGQGHYLAHPAAGVISISGDDIPGDLINFTPLGDSVIANPGGSPPDTLSTVSIDGTPYAITGLGWRAQPRSG